ncbi:PD-(D/E)XK nuclease family protein [Desulfotomaculum copahuensis]|uniref:PD-(D/E)XK endonuclease-like domain-containing protein n=1 Tax=Desulfotomaculum copahuensis TaxID=1838280 RepID=A0A1B7LAQ4_9FIRM|nr:PD-(D/E)XK nuclease family protein [Desulfotomaculum copahuensis]OAT79409.1 hypothetical protein A6M21_01375 [Desulfotomaculum copahuensis]
MNRLLSYLDSICRRFPVTEKILVVPDPVSGNEIGLALARSGCGWANLRGETTTGLAMQVAGAALSREKIRFLPGHLTELVLEEVWQELEAGNILRYYRRTGGAAGLVRALANTVFELRMNGLTARDVPGHGLAAAGKGSDLRAVLGAFERYLADRGYIDFPGLLKLALKLPAAPGKTGVWKGDNAAPLNIPTEDGSAPERLFLVPSFIHFYPLEKKLIARLAGRELIVIPAEPVYGLATPDGYWPLPEGTADGHSCPPGANRPGGGVPSTGEASDAAGGPARRDGCSGIQYRTAAAEAEEGSGWPLPGNGPATAVGTGERPPVASGVERLAWLYRVAGAPPPACDGSVQCFHAHGITAEVREVLRRIMAAGLSLDQVTVVYTSEAYIPLFYELTRRFGLGLTVAGGIPVSFTRPGRALQGLVEWIKSGFSARVLGDLLTGGDLQLRLPVNAGAGRNGSSGHTRTVPGITVARLLRDAGIAWGRERYRLLSDLSLAYRRRAEFPGEGEDGGRRDWLLERAALADQLFTLLAELLAMIPRPDERGRVDFAALVEGMAGLLRRLAAVRDEMDKPALHCLLQYLEQAATFPFLALDLEEALKRVGETVGGLRAGAGSSRPGSLHLVDYQRAVWTDRRCTFFVGLDAGAFPGVGRPDPVLLDDERDCFMRPLPRSSSRLREGRYALAQALASRRGRVWLSYSSCDVMQNRLSAPSPVLLQACRLLAGDPFLDYSDLARRLGAPAAYSPPGGEPALDDTEWWLHRALAGPGTGGVETVALCYSGPGRGLRAAAARRENRLTEYDGKLASVNGDFDPGREPRPVLSSGRLEILAGCPFRYFLQYGLQISPPEERDYDPGRWLSPLERGQLLHQVFYRFMRRITERGERPNPRRHRELIMEMADELIAEYRHQVPVPGEVAVEREKREIRRACAVFLAAEEQLPVHVSPACFEVPFGLGPEAVFRAGCGMPDPVAVELEHGTGLLLCGKIDRIDQAGEGVYHIWDYKTGSTGDYDEKDFLKQGRRLQHALYALAAEKILAGMHPGENPRVEKTGYYFPTERGAGLRLACAQGGREVLREALSCLYGLLKKGIFLPASSGDRCRYCGYREACGGEETAARINKLLETGDPCLTPWKMLQKID